MIYLRRGLVLFLAASAGIQAQTTSVDPRSLPAGGIFQSVILKSTEFRGSEFLQGYFGDGIQVGQIRSWEDGEALASILIDEHARLGLRTIVVRAGQKELVFRDAFRVTPRMLRVEQITRESGWVDKVVRLTLLYAPANATVEQFSITLDPHDPEPTRRVTLHPFFLAFANDRLTLKFLVPRESVPDRRALGFQVSVRLTTHLGDTASENEASIELIPSPRLRPGPPLLVHPGHSMTVLVPCDNASFSQEPLSISFGPDIAVKSAWIDNENRFGSGIQIARDAKAGPRNLVVRLGAETLQSPNALVIELEPFWEILMRHITALRKWYSPRN